MKSSDGSLVQDGRVEDTDQPLSVIPRGGGKEVGRSCYHVKTPEVELLIDCGIKQGQGGQFPDLEDIEQGQIDAVILTHAHIDHSGGLPVLEHRRLLARDAPIITTRPTTAICHTLLHDSIKIHKEEAEKQGREQQFTRDDVHDVTERFTPHRYGEHRLSADLPRLETPDDIEYRLGGSGHLLGSAWVSIEYGGRRVVFSGDLGGRSAHLPEIETPPAADTLFLESTYGDTQQHRSLKSARNQLYQEAIDAVTSGIPVLIPSFAVGRAQEVMQIFRERFPQESDEVRDQLEVIYDGMARDATAAYHAFSVGEFVQEKINNWRVNAQDNEPFLPDCAWFPKDNSERAPILDGERAPIIVAPSGMLTGGTSPLYLTALIENYDEARIMFTGYQAEGTPGRVLQGASGSQVEVELPTTPFRGSDLEIDDGKTTVAVPTSWIRTIRGFSGHCAAQVLYEFASDVDPKHVALIHGDSDAQTHLRNYLSNNLKADVVTRACMDTPIPIYGDAAGELTGVDTSTGAATSMTVRPTAEVDTSHVTDSIVDNGEPEDEEPEPDQKKSAAPTKPNQSTSERVERLEEKVKELEKQLTIARHDRRWTEGEIRRLVREEISGSTSAGGDESVSPSTDSGDVPLLHIDGVGPRIVEQLASHGYETDSDFEAVTAKELTEVDYVGDEIAGRIVNCHQG